MCVCISLPGVLVMHKGKVAAEVCVCIYIFTWLISDA